MVNLIIRNISHKKCKALFQQVLQFQRRGCVRLTYIDNPAIVCYAWFNRVNKREALLSRKQQKMDGYILGFVAISGMTILIGVMAVIFLSFEGTNDADVDYRIRYTQVRQVTTNTIETVNVHGETEVWRKSA